MADIFTLDQIKKALKHIDPVPAIEEGFVAYSRGDVVVPPVGEMIFQNPPGDVHIKYGHIRNDDVYVIKVASGFYENAQHGLPSSSGLMLVFSQKTGMLNAVLLDEGHLTDIRTAAAGAVAAKVLAPEKIDRIGILGAGTQGRLQLEFLKRVVACRDALVWGIHQEELDRYIYSMGSLGFQIQTTLDASEVAASCNLIVTATPAKTPLIKADLIRPGTHITAMGSDTPEKIELDPVILGKADLVVADSLSQCRSRGEIFQALQSGVLKMETVLELGNVIAGASPRRTSDCQTTVADLTGVAVQDIQIAKAVCQHLRA
jgi:ornithine cyclodeaminase